MPDPKSKHPTVNFDGIKHDVIRIDYKTQEICLGKWDPAPGMVTDPGKWVKFTDRKLEMHTWKN